MRALVCYGPLTPVCRMVASSVQTVRDDCRATRHTTTRKKIRDNAVVAGTQEKLDEPSPS